MTEKQKRFCDEYLIDLNATRAYKAAYPKTTHNATAAANGSRLLNKTEIADYIQSKIAEISSDKTAKAQEVMEYLTSVMRGESVTKVPFVIDDAVQFVEKGPDEKERLRAAELLGKRWGLFNDKVNLESGIPDRLDKLGEILLQIKG